MKRFVTVAAAAVLWIGGAGVARADSIGIHFEASEGYAPGSIDHQNGWAGTAGSPINPAIDQAVVANTYGYPTFGGQSWRMSNAYTDGAFGDWPFSPSLQNEAGETNAQNGGFSGGVRQNHFEVQWDFASTVKTAEQPGLQISTSPDRGDGARMSFIRMRDNPGGLSVEFVDYQDRAPFGAYGSPLTAARGCGPEDDFVLTTVASGLERDHPHTVRLVMDFIDGPRNDVVKVYVDGSLRHVGTSWEDYFRWCPESGGGTGTTAADQSRTVDSMIFQARTSGGTAPGTLNNGFLFDNLFYSSSSVEQCDNRHADGDGDVQDSGGHKGHMHFHKGGCGHNDGDGVQHDDDQQGHHFQSTSVDSAQYSTALDGRTVVITGTGVDNGLPVAFTLTAIDHDGLLPGAYTLVLSDGYTLAGTLLDGGTLTVL